MNDAEYIKAQILNWLLSRITPGDILASELRFQHGERRADLAFIGENRLCAIEIKSSIDDFRKVEKQLNSYSKSFLEVYLAVDERDAKIATSILPTTVGLIIVRNNAPLRIQKKASIRKKLKKQDAINWLTTEELKPLIINRMQSISKLKKEDLEKIVINALSADELTKYAIECILGRLRKRFNLFKLELGEKVTSDDVKILSAPSQILIGKPK